MVAPTGIKRSGALRRWVAPALFSVGLGVSASACSDAAEPCDPPIPPGARYRVTVGAETPTSQKCHVVRVEGATSTFVVMAGEHPPQLGRQACFTTPAAQPPPQQSIQLEVCDGAQTEQLGVRCQMQYPASCPGQVWFYFDSPQGGAPVNWSAPVIDAVFKIRDEATSCIPGGILANCVDEYFARLERL